MAPTVLERIIMVEVNIKFWGKPYSLFGVKRVEDALRELVKSENPVEISSESRWVLQKLIDSLKENFEKKVESVI